MLKQKPILIHAGKPSTFHRFMVACCAMSLAIVLQTASAFCQPPLSPDGDSQWHVRYELFQWLLQQQGLQTRLNIDDALRSPDKSVVVMLGDLRSIQRSTWNDLRRFLSQGGNCLIATDQSCVMGEFGKVSAGPVTSTRAEFQYQSFADCLTIRDLDYSDPLTSHVFEVITNRAGYLTKPASNQLTWQVVGSLPTNCRPLSSRGQPLLAFCRDRIDAHSGIAVLSSDASFFTNSMVWHGDNGQLVVNVAKLLNKENKSQMVFLVDGKPMAHYVPGQRPSLPKQMPAPELPEANPDLETMLRFANLAMKKVSDSNIVNEAIMKHPRQFNSVNYFHWIWRTLAALAAAGVIFALIKRRHVIPPFLNPRRMKSLYEIQDVGMHPLDRNRQAALLLARDFCRKWTGKHTALEWQRCLDELTSSHKDHSEEAISFNEQATIETLFRIAISGKTGLVSDAYLEQLGALIERLLRQQPPSP